MSIVKEDARITPYRYTSTVYTACQSCTTATIHLEAIVKDISVTPDANGDVQFGIVESESGESDGGSTVLASVSFFTPAAPSLPCGDPFAFSKGDVDRARLFCYTQMPG